MSVILPLLPVLVLTGIMTGVFLLLSALNTKESIRKRRGVLKTFDPERGVLRSPPNKPKKLPAPEEVLTKEPHPYSPKGDWLQEKFPQFSKGELVYLLAQLVPLKEKLYNNPRGLDMEVFDFFGQKFIGFEKGSAYVMGPKLQQMIDQTCAEEGLPSAAFVSAAVQFYGRWLKEARRGRVKVSYDDNGVPDGFITYKFTGSLTSEQERLDEEITEEEIEKAWKKYQKRGPKIYLQ